MTTRAARALLEGIVDYAGLFPPARLPLDEAVRAYAGHRRDAASWMLARFILPAARLDDMEALHPVLAGGGPYEISLLAGGGDGGDTFETGVSAALARAAAFERAHDGEVRIGQLELRLPGRANDASALVATALTATHEALGRAVPTFVEASPGDSLEARIAEAAHAAAASSSIVRSPVGLKLRCGGLEPDAFPATGLVARTLLVCRDLGIPFKATAGLHHPLRGVEGPGGAVMHGFLNVFGGGALGIARGLDEPGLAAILEERDAGAFVLDDERLSWRDLHIGADELARIRRERLISFGSCSFDEPRDDLESLGILQEANA